MDLFFSALIGYLLGSLSPSALLSKIKNKDMRKHGTGNLGATNAMLNFGKRLGVLVMLFDIFKAVAAMKIAQLLYPDEFMASLIAGAATVIGHIFPFYLKFRGGKGLASFGGMILGYSPVIFAILVVVCCTLMLVINYSVALPISAAVLFPVFVWFKSRSLPIALICAAVSVVIILRHIGSIRRACSGKDNRIREYILHEMFNK